MERGETEIKRLIDMAGDWIETDPSLRSTACIEVALDHAKAIEMDRDRLRGMLATEEAASEELRQRVEHLEQINRTARAALVSHGGFAAAKLQEWSDWEAMLNAALVKIVGGKGTCDSLVETLRQRVEELEQENARLRADNVSLRLRDRSTALVEAEAKVARYEADREKLLADAGEWEQEAVTAQAEVKRLEGLIAPWLSTNETEATAATSGLLAEARIRKREARNG